MKQEVLSPLKFLNGQCGQPQSCPLSRIQTGSIVCIKGLATPPKVKERLREMGLCEEQRIKLLAKDSNYICQVCNTRLGISEKLADSILVEPV